MYIRVGTPALYLVDEVSQYIGENSISGGTSWPTTKQDLHRGKARADVGMDWSDSNLVFDKHVQLILLFTHKNRVDE